MKTDWTDKIREKLSQSAVTPPDDIWAAISSELEAAGAVPPVRRSAKKAWRWCAAAACLGAAIVCGVLLITRDPSGIGMTPTPTACSGETGNDSTNVNENLITQRTPTVPKSLSASNSPATAAKTSYPKQKITDISKSPSTNLTETENLDIEAENSTRDMVMDNLCEVREGDYDTALPDSATSAPSYIEDLPPLRNDAPLFANNLPEKRHISFGFYASSVDLRSNDNDLLYEADNWGLGSRPPVGNNFFDYVGVSSSSSYNSNYVLTDSEHRQPVRFGSSLRIPLSNSLSIGTGATYSRLSSSLTFRSDGYKKIEADQTLHYIGIPVSVDYALPSYRSVGFYLTAGAMAEKCVYGRLKLTENGLNGSVSEKALQLSAFAGAGVQIGLYKGLSLYLEPVAGYYFDNHSTVCNIYKDRPFNLDLRLGLRYTTK